MYNRVVGVLILTGILPSDASGKTDDRPQFQRLLKKVKVGDTIVYDEVSRMSRNAEEGYRDYQELYKKEIELVFIKEPQINTAIIEAMIMG